MTVQIVTARRSLTGSAVRRILGRCALAVIGASFAAISISTVQPSAPPDAKLDHLAAHAQVIDRLYEELIRWTPPACSSALASASIAGRC
jgi:hypothetical protein